VSGQLVGEVIAARRGVLAYLSQAQTLALIAIANRCDTATRQHWVAYPEIMAAVGCSRRTAERTIAALKKDGWIEVVQRGYNTHGVVRSPVYRLAELPPPKMAEAQANVFPPCASAKSRCASAKSECASAKSAMCFRHPGWRPRRRGRRLFTDVRNRRRWGARGRAREEPPDLVHVRRRQRPSLLGVRPGSRRHGP